MLEFTWPWVFILLPLPYLVYRLFSQAPRQDAALYVPFFSILSRLQSDNESLSSGRLLSLICCTLIWLLIIIAASIIPIIITVPGTIITIHIIHHSSSSS